MRHLLRNYIRQHGALGGHTRYELLLPRVRFPVPEPPLPATRRVAYNIRFAAATAQGRRPVPFRTRKLRPGTAMVLHPIGCGRVARRRITFRRETRKGLPFSICAHRESPVRTVPRPRPAWLGTGYPLHACKDGPCRGTVLTRVSPGRTGRCPCGSIPGEQGCGKGPSHRTVMFLRSIARGVFWDHLFMF